MTLRLNRLLTLFAAGCVALTAMAAPAAKKERNARNQVTSTVRAMSTSPISCPSSATCNLMIDIHAPNTYRDPDTGALVPECVAVVRNSPISIPKGHSGHLLKWTLVKTNPGGDPRRYEFDQAKGIDLAWPKPRYRNNANRDFRNPSRVAPDVFQWEVINSRRRDDATCHDPGNANENVNQAGKKCEIAFVPVVYDSDRNQCLPFDPTILNGGP